MKTLAWCSLAVLLVAALAGGAAL
ncbi:MAG: hypothetical protein XU13_C0125G0001, partial [Candidatus Rokubacteria bacterium CSP1-6]